MQDVAWPSLARTGRPGFQARWAGRGGQDHRQVHLPRAVAGRDRTNSCSVPERDVILHGEFLLIPASGKLLAASIGRARRRSASPSNVAAVPRTLALSARRPEAEAAGRGAISRALSDREPTSGRKREERER